MPQLILFDCDGTLTDSHGLIVSAMQQAFTLAGIEPPTNAAVSAIIGMSLRGAVLALLDKKQAETPALVEKILDGYRDSYRESEQQIQLFPHVSETLAELRERGYWLGVVTGKSHAGLLRVLESFNLRDLFLVLRTADCTHSKPHPAMVLECMAEMGVSCNQTMVVGDALFDIQMANAAEVGSIGVSFGVAKSGDLMAAGAQVVVEDFSALLDHFQPLHSSD